MISIQNVTKQFYQFKAIDNVSFTIPRGEVVGLLGPNGAGKTTLFKLIAGILQPDKGKIYPHAGTWPAIGYKTDRLLFPNHLRVKQYLKIVTELSGAPPSQTERVLTEALARVDLLSAANKKIGACSKGMRQRLGLAQALIGDPPLLLLDEPSNGLDPAGQDEMYRRIQELHAAGKTILLSSHQLPEVTQVCTHLIILNRGQIHYQSSMVDALTVSPYALIETDRPIASPLLLAELHALHPGIQVEGSRIYLRDAAMRLRRDILAMVLRAGYDVLHVEQKHITLAEIYAEAVQ
ncbi:MAG: ABC transporter ATP-binding protein [Chloroflexi bacterium]|nr:ABC transporter ATP-binding protein [Ardenticatenaceae bacterium]MBL1129446.1 ABC transporter ATP-binding protein [Chloroflexota bacterium]NOG35525.1 ABC transporter ATP-binding protein [Chloroflexota bacterium]GIK55720.1 MAG: ABC transporter [Chloroflexota bacterium]